MLLGRRLLADRGQSADGRFRHFLIIVKLLILAHLWLLLGRALNLLHLFVDLLVIIIIIGTFWWGGLVLGWQDRELAVAGKRVVEIEEIVLIVILFGLVGLGGRFLGVVVVEVELVVPVGHADLE